MLDRDPAPARSHASLLARSSPNEEYQGVQEPPEEVSAEDMARFQAEAEALQERLDALREEPQAPEQDGGEEQGGGQVPEPEDEQATEEERTGNRRLKDRRSAMMAGGNSAPAYSHGSLLARSSMNGNDQGGQQPTDEAAEGEPVSFKD